MNEQNAVRANQYNQSARANLAIRRGLLHCLNLLRLSIQGSLFPLDCLVVCKVLSVKVNPHSHVPYLHLRELSLQLLLPSSRLTPEGVLLRLCRLPHRLLCRFRALEAL